MPLKTYGNTTVDVDAEGYLTDFSQWTRTVAEAIAAEEGFAAPRAGSLEGHRVHAEGIQGERPGPEHPPAQQVGGRLHQGALRAASGGPAKKRPGSPA